MSSFQSTFLALDRWLYQHKALWQFDSFASLDIPWRGDYPELASFIERTDLATLQESPAGIFQYCPSLQESEHWQKHPDLASMNDSKRNISPPSYFSAGIKGRKWQQINAFVKKTPMADSYLEWCSGKGHLGKLLAYQGNALVYSIEWQAALCQEGQEQADKLSLKQVFTQTDVLKGEGDTFLQKASCAVALHACGDLHRVLIEAAIQAKTPRLGLSPCCYHLTSQPVYLPMSQFAHNSALRLRKADLKLAVKEVATAGLREQRLKQLELSYRLGFDAWQRCARQKEEYLPIPSIQKSLLTKGFHAFCQWAAEQKGLHDFMSLMPFDEFESIGENRAQLVQKIEQVSQVFRPALEYWLILDRAMRLEEQGYKVEIGAFCEKSLTPRNWMILAGLS